MSLSLEIQLYTEKSCDDLFLEDMTGLYVAGTNEGGYGPLNVTINDITQVFVEVNYTALGVSTLFTFDVTNGVITSAGLSLDGGILIDIYPLMTNYDWPFTDVNPLNLTTTTWSNTLPAFDDMVYSVEYSVVYTPGSSPVTITTESSSLIDCKTCCCVSKKSVTIDMNNTESLVAMLVPTAYLQTAKFAADNGLIEKANAYIQKAKNICDQNDCGCGC